MSVDWQPIETAPKDKRILIYVPPDDVFGVDIIYVVVWNGERWEEALGEGWTTFEPTHWMPLPKRPE